MSKRTDDSQLQTVWAILVFAALVAVWLVVTSPPEEPGPAKPGVHC